ncbi:hypothetical protein [Pseudobdellovibrio exovorus]|uniref:Uncharacterized protein n=1 Tax=Pseudobdellovibrio exovorus JSS TaxID=1184267 RepID=M4V9C9_9BACT|nr:hypothetical protein [Pseudobdellovibrio exovorus]AGH95833.1 hypothetical protein A11Q_1617 [Pseudobdellovibrio exovorus JSS]
MSNSSDQLDLNTALNGSLDSNSTAPQPTHKSNQMGRWSFIQQELENAIHNWDVLESNSPKLSPDEEQMVKIKGLIGQLKSKLEQF